MKRRTGAVLLLAGMSTLGMGLSRPRREDPKAVALLSQIVQVHQVVVDSVRVERRLLNPETTEHMIRVAQAIEDWRDARVRLAHEQSDPDAERAALNDALELLRELYRDGERRQFDMNRANLGVLQLPVLETELLLLRLDE